jgi:hypothetical protein
MFGYKGKNSDIPLGTGLINEAKTAIQKRRKAQYDVMRETGMMSDLEYNKAIKALGY